MRFGLSGRSNRVFLDGIRSTVKDVVPRRSVEHRRVLRDHPNLPPEAFLRYGANILTIDPNLSVFARLEPQEQ